MGIGNDCACPCCGMDIYGYGDDECEIHGKICMDCAHECQGCGRRGCHDDRSGRGCLIEHDFGYFCDIGHVKEYAREQGLTL